MPASSLLALIDDIATILDDVSVMTKVATKKTAGVLGDDLALNAEQVTGVKADRELPVVWAVARGSMINKAILVPAALLISAFVPALIVPLLMIGGAFLCYEGIEKLLHPLLHRQEEEQQEHAVLIAALAAAKRPTATAVAALRAADPMFRLSMFAERTPLVGLRRERFMTHLRDAGLDG